MIQKKLLTQRWFWLMALAWFGHAAATLPVAVNGQQLPSLAPILERVTPAVVNIKTSSVTYTRSNDFYRWFYGLPSVPQERVTQSLGSGVIVDADKGLILTNHHVIADADDITVVLHDNRHFNAKVVGSDDGTDVALIQIEADNLVALPLADSGRLRVGDFVVAVGNPFGLGQTVTSGIVSALGRSNLANLDYQNFIQTDASINPGNSGGALIDLNGSLVGINTAIFSPSGGNVGIGFAIPSSLAARMMRQLLEFGTVRRGSLGIAVQNIDARLGKALELEPHKGVLISAVEKNSPAAKIKLRAGDVLLALDGVPINSRKQFENRQGLLELNRAVDLSFMREHRKRTVSVKISEADRQQISGAELHRSLQGAVLSNLPAQYRDTFQGVWLKTVEQRSQAWRLGLRSGDLIVAVNQQAVTNIRQLNKHFNDEPMLKIYRNGRYYLLTLD